jgi:hypothetical protein
MGTPGGPGPARLYLSGATPTPLTWLQSRGRPRPPAAMASPAARLTLLGLVLMTTAAEVRTLGGGPRTGGLATCGALLHLQAKPVL